MNKRNIQLIFCITLAAISLVFLPTGARADTSPEDQKTIEELKKTYTMDTCPVSGEKLNGDMGKPIDYLYKTKVNGKDTVRLVRFCCGGCPAKFLKDPDKYLKIIDDSSKPK